jgi:hypothetical protein
MKTMKVKLIFKTYDSWIGTFNKFETGRHIIYIFPVIWFGIKISYSVKSKSGPRIFVLKSWPVLSAILIYAAWIYIMWPSSIDAQYLVVSTVIACYISIWIVVFLLVAWLYN